jgi:hypothetical protein
VSVYQLFKTLTKDEKVFDSYANRKARDDTATSSTSVSKLKSRKYCKGYLSLGLKSVCIGGKEQHKCLIRHKTFSVDSKKPSKRIYSSAEKLKGQAKLKTFLVLLIVT